MHENKIEMDEDLKSYQKQTTWAFVRSIIILLSTLALVTSIILITSYAAADNRPSTLMSNLNSTVFILSAILILTCFNLNKKFDTWRETIYTRILDSVYDKTKYTIQETSVDLIQGILFNSTHRMLAVNVGSYKGSRDDGDDDCANIVFHLKDDGLYYELNKI